MTTTIQNLSDLQDRRIMMDKKLPPYGYAFVILTGLFMIFLVIWSTQTNRIYVSQNSGVVQAANKTYIMSSYSGSITELYVSEGSYVNEGDLIARLKSTDLDMQKDTVIQQITSVALDPTNRNIPITISNIQDVVVNGESLGLGGYLDIGLYDTMGDLIVNLIGAVVFSVIGYFHQKHRKKSVVTQLFVPQVDEKEEDVQHE